MPESQTIYSQIAYPPFYFNTGDLLVPTTQIIYQNLSDDCSYTSESRLNTVLSCAGQTILRSVHQVIDQLC